MPELAQVVDSFEQRVQCPKIVVDRDGWYSGKKKMHTVKSQIVIESESGRIGQSPTASPHSCITTCRGLGASALFPYPEC